MLSTTESEDMTEDFQQYSRESRRSILKLPDKPITQRRKSAHWDENNIRNTLHLEGQVSEFIKGHQTKPLFDWESLGVPNALQVAANESRDALQMTSHENTANRNVYSLVEQKLQLELKIDQERTQKKKEFEEKRKAHYNEYKALLASQELLKCYDEKDEEENNKTEEEKAEETFSKNCEEIVHEAEISPEVWERKRPKIENIPNT